jgi:proliferating cell nuclear antigen PCNA
MTETLFRARTSEGYIIKVLSELLHNNIKVGCFEIDKTGIFFRMMDTHRRLCIDFALFGENFSSYMVNSDQKILLGVNLMHLKKMLKPIKKKDSLEFSKDKESSENLCIKIIPKELGKITTSYIKIQDIQNIDLDLPEGYENYVSIPSSDYQKMCKDMESISQNINLKATRSTIRFTADMTCVYSRSIIFGEGDDSDESKIIYNQHFESDQLNNLGRISGLGITTGNNIQIFCKSNLPILFRTNIGTLGKINIYIKSKEQVEKEKEDYSIGNDK